MTMRLRNRQPVVAPEGPVRAMWEAEQAVIAAAAKVETLDAERLAILRPAVPPKKRRVTIKRPRTVGASEPGQDTPKPTGGRQASHGERPQQRSANRASVATSGTSSIIRSCRCGELQDVRSAVIKAKTRLAYEAHLFNIMKNYSSDELKETITSAGQEEDETCEHQSHTGCTANAWRNTRLEMTSGDSQNMSFADPKVDDLSEVFEHQFDQAGPIDLLCHENNLDEFFDVLLDSKAFDIVLHDHDYSKSPQCIHSLA